MSYSEKPNFLKNFFIWFGIYLLITAIVYSASYLIFSAMHKSKSSSPPTAIKATSSPTVNPTLTSEINELHNRSDAYYPTISNQEKQQIDAWIQKNNLNQYGDPKDTMYPGGTPLFNEATGKTIDRYEYIVNKHPDKPWSK